MGNLQGKFPQKLEFCLPLAALGGVFEVFATALLAYSEARDKEGRGWPAWGQKLALVGNIVLQISASMLGNLLAPWFGPVSQVGTFFMAAQLLANMVIFGWALGLECFTKDMKIGTYIVVTSVVLMLAVGPSTQDDQDVIELLESWYTTTWSSIIVALMIISFAALIYGITGLTEAIRILILLLARSTAFTVNLTVSRVMLLKTEGVYFIISIILKVVSGAVMTFAIVIQSTAVPQGKFVPLNASAIILINALTGIVIWEDWKTIEGVDWLGYACTFVLIFLGNYLLLGTAPLLDAANEKFGRRMLLMRVTGMRQLFLPEITFNNEGTNETPGENFLNGDNKEALSISDRTKSKVLPPRTASSRDIWKSVYACENPQRHRRVRNIFILDDEEEKEILPLKPRTQNESNSDANGKNSSGYKSNDKKSGNRLIGPRGGGNQVSLASLPADRFHLPDIHEHVPGTRRSHSSIASVTLTDRKGSLVKEFEVEQIPL